MVRNEGGDLELAKIENLVWAGKTQKLYEMDTQFWSWFFNLDKCLVLRPVSLSGDRGLCNSSPPTQI